MVAVTVHGPPDGGTAGAVNEAVATPEEVWAKGVIVPHVVVKATVDPSGAGLPVLSVTVARNGRYPVQRND